MDVDGSVDVDVDGDDINGSVDGIYVDGVDVSVGVSRGDVDVAIGIGVDVRGISVNCCWYRCRLCDKEVDDMYMWVM